MTFKTILAHCDGSRSVSHRLAVARDVAGRFDAMLKGIYANAPFEPPLSVGKAFDMAELFHAYQHSFAVDKAAAHAAFAEALASTAVTAEWRSHDGHAGTVLACSARCADLVVVGQTEPERSPGIPDDLPEAVALQSGRPVLVVPYIGAAKPVGQTVLVCWNGTKESARAAADAMPFLKAAKQVVALTIDQTASNRAPCGDPGLDVATWLARHGVKVRAQRDVAHEADVAEVILSCAADHDADLIVMGVYGHSRLREIMLGGVSRKMLESMTVPVLMSH